MKTFINKFRSENGESLLETLIAITIIALTTAFLSTAIVTASKINSALKNTDLGFFYEDGKTVGTSTIIATNSVSSTNNDTSILKKDSKVTVVQDQKENYLFYYGQGS